MGAPNLPQTSSEILEPQLPALNGVVDRALSGAEFRDVRARDRLRALLQGDEPVRYAPPGSRHSASVVFAQPPNDLAALLRLADQLDQLAQQEEGERALVWKCESCATRYAVPVALVRDVAIRCERCGNAVALKPAQALGEESLVDPLRGAVNAARRELALFFREAMARGWPVLVAAPQG